VLIDQCAYSNRWRAVTPAAKGIFALAGFVSAFAAGTPAAALCIALLMSATTIFGAGIPLARFVRAACVPFGFFLLGSVSLACSVEYHGGDFSIVWLPNGPAPVARVVARSCAALASLLFFALTTPMIDQIALFRRLKIPETLIEIMVLCYRMLFVFSATLRDVHTAQDARLGYATPKLALRSMGSMAAGLTVQIWRRAQALHLGAMSRNGEGPFRFLAPVFINSRRDVGFAIAAGALVLSLSCL
jgi:cobalt/nickel transport system permease protein